MKMLLLLIITIFNSQLNFVNLLDTFKGLTSLKLTDCFFTLILLFDHKVALKSEIHQNCAYRDLHMRITTMLLTTDP